MWYIRQGSLELGWSAAGVSGLRSVLRVGVSGSDGSRMWVGKARGPLQGGDSHLLHPRVVAGPSWSKSAAGDYGLNFAELFC